MKNEITISPQGGCIRVMWDDEKLSETLCKLFVPWQAVGRGFSENCRTISIKTSPDGYIISSSASTDVSCASVPELVMHIEDSLTQTALSILETSLLIHSAVVDLNGKGALIAGDHDSGKTTLTLSAISSGFKALSDEVGFIQDGFRSAAGFPRPFHVTSDLFAMKPSIIPDKCGLFRVSGNFSFVFFDEYYTAHTDLSCIVFPRRRPGKTVVQETGEVETVRLLLPHGFNLSAAPDGRLQDIVSLVKNVRAFIIQYQNHGEAVSAIRDIINGKI